MGHARHRHWQNRSVVITGAASGIGRALAEAILMRGAYVCWVDIDRSVLDLAETLGARASGVVADVTDAAAFGRIIENTADILVDGRAAGVAGQLHPRRAREMDVETAVLVAELDAAVLCEILAGHGRCEELDRFPAVTRDIAMETPASLPNADLRAFFDSRDEPLLVKAELFDVFADPSGEKLPADKKSLAYSSNIETRMMQKRKRRFTLKLIKFLVMLLNMR